MISMKNDQPQRQQHLPQLRIQHQHQHQYQPQQLVDQYESAKRILKSIYLHVNVCACVFPFSRLYLVSYFAFSIFVDK